MEGRPPADGRLRSLARWRGWSLVVAFVLAASPVREVVRSFARGRSPGTPLDRLLAPLVDALPPSGRVGWVVDATKSQRAMEARVALQYAAAPRIVTEVTEGLANVVAWAPDPASLDRVVLGHGLRVLERFAPGYALCAPKRGP